MNATITQNTLWDDSVFNLEVVDEETRYYLNQRRAEEARRNYLNIQYARIEKRFPFIAEIDITRFILVKRGFYETLAGFYHINIVEFLQQMLGIDETTVSDTDFWASLRGVVFQRAETRELSPQDIIVLLTDSIELEAVTNCLRINLSNLYSMVSELLDIDTEQTMLLLIHRDLIICATELAEKHHIEPELVYQFICENLLQ